MNAVNDDRCAPGVRFVISKRLQVVCDVRDTIYAYGGSNWELLN